MDRAVRFLGHLEPAAVVASSPEGKAEEVFVVSAARTPMGSFNGALSSFTAPELGALAVKAALERARVAPTHVDEVFLGNVLSAGLGQAPARQAALGAGLEQRVPCTTVNKVCSSGMKAAAFGYQAIRLGDAAVCVVGGFESMSRVPYLVPAARFGARLGDSQLVDGLVADGLTDVYNKYHMGRAAELCAHRMGIPRAAQDAYAIESFSRATEASRSGMFRGEIVPVTVRSRKGEVVVSEDEGFKKFNKDKLPKLRPAFGAPHQAPEAKLSVTAGNSSSISDGAAAMVLASESKVRELGLKPVARIVAFADAARAPEEFTIAPADAMRRALDKVGLTIEDISFFEINEAFSVVVLANQELMGGIPRDRVNVFGGAVSLGHPLGCSGARIMTTLINVLQQNKARYGLAGICNGGGGASACIIERCGE